MKKIVILGSTGSIGTQTLEVIDHLKGQWKVLGLTANNNINLLEKQALKYRPEFLVIGNEELKSELEYRVRDMDIKVLTGDKGLEYLSGGLQLDLVINALVGAVGLKPTMAALKSGNVLGLANKESLVVGGEIIEEYREGSKILPVDSEHNAIFQLLEGHSSEEVERIILTASGGPFRNYSYEELKNVTVQQALDHPNWDMGGKITIDSATMMNKGLEVIEAHWLFKQPYDKISVVVHPESIIHSMVEFKDQSITAELGVADMRIPIQYVLTYPDRKNGQSKRLDLLEVSQLNFQEPDFDKFPALKLAFQVGRQGGTMPAVMNAANEIAVSHFLNRDLSFLAIPRIIEQVMEKHNNINKPSLDDIYQVDKWARCYTEEVVSLVNSN
ncbi:MAG: 1-deoxy-D-xylulose-5-phosphate reductoisomerase [Halanaerobiales bacterium]